MPASSVTAAAPCCIKPAASVEVAAKTVPSTSLLVRVGLLLPPMLNLLALLIRVLRAE
jgi:hypothetical protein